MVIDNLYIDATTIRFSHLVIFHLDGLKDLHQCHAFISWERTIGDIGDVHHGDTGMTCGHEGVGLAGFLIVPEFQAGGTAQQGISCVCPNGADDVITCWCDVIRDSVQVVDGYTAATIRYKCQVIPDDYVIGMVLTIDQL